MTLWSEDMKLQCSCDSENIYNENVRRLLKANYCWINGDLKKQTTNISHDGIGQCLFFLTTDTQTGLSGVYRLFGLQQGAQDGWQIVPNIAINLDFCFWHLFEVTSSHHSHLEPFRYKAANLYPVAICRLSNSAASLVVVSFLESRRWGVLPENSSDRGPPCLPPAIFTPPFRQYSSMIEHSGATIRQT